jgi:hypothetical protein
MLAGKGERMKTVIDAARIAEEKAKLRLTLDQAITAIVHGNIDFVLGYSGPEWYCHFDSYEGPTHEESGSPCGTGNTPQEALDDLIEKLED